MARPKSILWVDDEVESLTSHILFLEEQGFAVETSAHGDDALALLQRQPYGVVLLDEQMPGRRGLELFRAIRAMDHGMPVVMVTKSEESETLKDAIGAEISDYLIKPVNPRQILSVVTRLLDGDRIRQQRLSRDFATRFRELEARRSGPLAWREWVELVAELAEWEVRLGQADEPGLQDALRTLQESLRQDFARYLQRHYARWLHDHDSDRPPLSVDIGAEFLKPVLDAHRRALLVVVDCLRLDQWAMIRPLISARFDIETAHYFSILPTATPFARNAIFSGLFPAEIKARYPKWWSDQEEASLNAHEAELLTEQLKELTGRSVPVHYEKVFTAADGEGLLRRLPAHLAQEGVTALVFNFIDQLTHGRTENSTLYEVARDTSALRNLTRTWFERSPLWDALREAERRRVPVLLTTDHGSIHCHSPATVFAKRDTTANLRYKFGDDLRAQDPDAALVVDDLASFGLPARAPGTRLLLATGDRFFVYPTKLREYQARYRGAFLHGGVSPEEVILPIALLDASRRLTVQTELRLLRMVRPYWGLLAAGLATTTLASVLDGFVLVILIPLLKHLFGTAGALRTGSTQLEAWVDRLVDPLVAGLSSGAAAARLVVVLALGLLVKNALSYASTQITVRAQEGLVRDLRVRLFDHLLTLDFAFFQRTRAGQLISALITEVDQTKTVITAALVSLFQNLVVVVVTLWLLSQISFRLTLFTLAFVPLLVLLLQRLIRRLRRHARARTRERGEITATVTERIAAIRLIRSYGEEAREAAGFERQASGYRRQVIRTQRYSSLTSPMTEVFSGFLVILIMWAATRPGLLGLDAPLAPETIIVFLMAALRLTSPLKTISGYPAVTAVALASAERVFQVLDEPAVEVDRPGEGEARFEREIVYDRVSFRYGNGDLVLSDVSFTIPRGRVVALVGPSGAGKTTLADLLPRFHDPTAGRILLDGVPLDRLTRRSIRALMGVVSQDTVLLNATVHVNIAYGSPRATRAQVEAAAEAANAAGFIRQLPEGYETVLGERGTRLSGGQRQRIAIARALLRDPPILILDEATSALDTESERLVQQAIDRLMQDRTVLVIAHRLATVRDADEIVVLDDGRVVQRGSHDALYRAGGLYRRLHDLQFREDESLADDGASRRALLP